MSPEQISAALGITPDRHWRRGDVRPRTALVEPESGWELRSRLPESADLEAHLDDLFAQLLPVAERARAIESTYKEMACASYAPYVPPAHLSASHVQKLAELGASIDFDLYVIPEETEEPSQ